MSAKPCPIHGKPPILVYPCCVGAKGGQATGGQKAASSRVNAAKARQASQAKRSPPGVPDQGDAPDRGPEAP